MNATTRTGKAVETSEAGIDSDLRAIQRVMTNYCWSLDSRDWERLAACFTDDVVFEASNMGRYNDRTSLLIAFQTRTIRTPVRRHMITNPYISLVGDTAEFTSYLQNVRVRFGAPGGEFFIAGGTYKNTLTRTPTGWKISQLRWEATYVEGNKALDPNIAPAPYLPVLKSRREAPWGGASAPRGDGDRSAQQRVRDLVNGFFRALDAGASEEAQKALARDASAQAAAKTAEGAQAIAEAFGPSPFGWSEHGLWNERVSASDTEARYAAYVYKVSNDGTATNRHSGGVLLVVCVPDLAGWRIRNLEYIEFWTRGDTITVDPVTALPGFARIATFVDDIGGNRLPWSTDEDEVKDLLARYAWSYDFWNFDAVADCFAENVQGIFTTGSTSVFLDRASMVPGIRRGRETQPYMQHYCTNYQVDVGLDGTSAEIRAYASTRRTEAGGGPVLVAGGRYDGYARKTDGKWTFQAFQYMRAHGPYDGGEAAASQG